MRSRRYPLPSYCYEPSITATVSYRLYNLNKNMNQESCSHAIHLCILLGLSHLVLTIHIRCVLSDVDDSAQALYEYSWLLIFGKR